MGRRTARTPANIDSPEVIRRFRAQLVRFEERCRAGLEDAYADVRKVKGWLQREMRPHWKRQLQRRQEMMEKARRDYAEAVRDGKYAGKTSAVDEKKALDRAIRLMEEAEGKLRAVKRWSLLLEQEIGKRLQPCRSLESRLDTLVPQALARLDQMLDSLDVYFHRSLPGLEG